VWWGRLARLCSFNLKSAGIGLEWTCSHKKDFKKWSAVPRRPRKVPGSHLKPLEENLPKKDSKEDPLTWGWSWKKGRRTLASPVRQKGGVLD